MARKFVPETKSTVYIVTVWVENDRSYADPYGRTDYDQTEFRYKKRVEAETFYREIKKSRRLNSKFVDQITLERKTTTLLACEKYD